VGLNISAEEIRVGVAGGQAELQPTGEKNNAIVRQRRHKSKLSMLRRITQSQQSHFKALLSLQSTARMLSTSTKIHPSKKVATQEVDVWTIT
jgi:hypothetical protein